MNHPLLMNVSVFLGAVAGFVALALAMDKHSEQWLGLTPTRPARITLRWAGAGLLVAALALCMKDWSWGVGPVHWLGWLNVAAVVLVFGMAWWPGGAKRESAQSHRPASSVLPMPHAHRRMARGLLVALLVGLPLLFAMALRQAPLQSIYRQEAFHGQIGPWTFRLAEIQQAPPEISAGGAPIKTFHLRFCDACNEEIRAAYFKVRRPRSLRTAGLAFDDIHGTRWGEIAIPPGAKLGDQLWLTVEGKDGSVHYLGIDFEQVSPATAKFIQERNPS